MDNKIYSVQYLRGLAALLVVVSHAWNHPQVIVNLDIKRLGALGVIIFFVISGFIMVMISGEGRFRAKDFLHRRVIRIVPLYWLFTTAAALLAAILPSLFKTTVFTWPHYLLSLFFIPHEAPGLGGTSPLLSLGWTLNYEAWFYLCFAMLAFLAARERVVALSILFLLLHAAGLVFTANEGVLGFYTDSVPLAFCAGAGLGLFTMRGRITALPASADMLATLAVISGLALAFLVGQGPEPGYPQLVGSILFALALMVLGLRFEGQFTPVRALVTLGDASYAIYLAHMFVIGALTAIAYRLLPVDNVYANIPVFGACILLSTAVGVFVHRLIEVPMLNHLRRGSRRRALSSPLSAGH